MTNVDWNPCPCPECSDRDPRSQDCGTSLRRGRYRAIATLSDESGDRSWHATDEDAKTRPSASGHTCHISVIDSDPRWHAAVQVLEAIKGRLGLPQLVEAWMEPGADNAGGVDGADGAHGGYIVRSWIEGQTLAQEMARSLPWDEPQVRSLLADALPVVQYLHSRRVIHGNLQPATLVRDRQRRLIPIGWGHARCLPMGSEAFEASELDLERDRRSSPLQRPPVSLPALTDYCAPERLRGGVTPASDLYSLGAIAVQCLTALSPLELYDAMDDRWHWRDLVLSETSVSPQFGRLLDRLLATTTHDRYARAIDVLSDLDDLPTRSPTLPDAPIATTIPIPPAPKAWQRWLGFPAQPALSPTGLDCTALRDALAAQNWSVADRETVRLLRHATRTSEPYLQGRELAALAADDLVMLDRLWREASDDRFGWSVQQRIYRESGGDYARFCGQVGWPLAVEQSHLTPVWQYRRSAPEGHLPSRHWAGGSAIEAVRLLFDRVSQCQIALLQHRSSSR